MTGLESLENDFQSFLLAGTAGIETRIVGTARVPIATRLAIYGNAYRSRLAETLEAHYPALVALMGAADFDKLCGAYIDAHESHFPSIRYYGGELAAFLATQRTTNQARLFRACTLGMGDDRSFDAADAVAIDVRVLGEVAPEAWAALRFELHPSLRRLDLLWNAPPLWKALTDNRSPPEAASQNDALAWLLWRRELQIYFRPLSPAEAQALDAVRAGQSFGELCVLLCASCGEEDAPARAAGYLREWVESGLIVGTSCREE